MHAHQVQLLVSVLLRWSAHWKAVRKVLSRSTCTRLRKPAPGYDPALETVTRALEACKRELRWASHLINGSSSFKTIFSDFVERHGPEALTELAQTLGVDRSHLFRIAYDEDEPRLVICCLIAKFFDPDGLQIVETAGAPEQANA